MNAPDPLEWTLVDADRGLGMERWLPPAGALPKGCTAELATLRGGMSEGVRVLTVGTGALTLAILPDRGMGLHRGQAGDVALGWRSPVRGPVHPCFVPVGEASGIGWLSGFDEFLVRCGLESNGAPDFDAQGRVKFPLHGRIANLPCQRLTVSVAPATHELVVRGEVDECRPLQRKLRLRTEYRLRPGAASVRVVDEIANLSAVAAEAQLLLHVNFGPPLAAPGSRVLVPVSKLAPRDAHAALDIPTWDRYPPAQAGFAEQVHFAAPLADGDGRTLAVLHNPDANRGAAVRWNVRQLPCFTLWKNPEAFEDGYVTGLEPGTNYPNPRSVEGKAGRVAKLAPGGAARFEYELAALVDAAAVRNAAAEVAALQRQQPAEISPQPRPEWSA